MGMDGLTSRACDVVEKKLQVYGETAAEALGMARGDHQLDSVTQLLWTLEERW